MCFFFSTKSKNTPANSVLQDRIYNENVYPQFKFTINPLIQILECRNESRLPQKALIIYKICIPYFEYVQSKNKSLAGK